MTRREVLQRIEEEMRLRRELRAEAMSVIADTRQHNDELCIACREITREAIAQVHRIGLEEMAELQRFGDQMQRFAEEQREVRAESRDVRAEGRAQREELLRRIDRIDPGGATA